MDTTVTDSSSSVYSVQTIEGRTLGMQGPMAIDLVEFSLDPNAGTAQLRCQADLNISLTGLAKGYHLKEVRRFEHKGFKSLVVEGSWSDFYRLWRRCAPSNLQAREQYTRNEMLTYIEAGLTKKAAAAIA